MDLDFTSTKSMDDFVSKTEMGHREPPEPVYLGFDSAMRYYLQSELVYNGVKTDLAKDKVEHPYITAFRAPSGTKQPFQYGFCLGSLKYTCTSWSKKDGGKERYEPLPWRVYVDVLTNKLWIVLQLRQEDDLGNEILLDASADPWTYFPSQKNGRASFDVMPLMDRKALMSVDEKRSFFTLDGAVRAKMTEWAAPQDVVEAAVKKAQAGPVTGSPAAAA